MEYSEEAGTETFEGHFLLAAKKEERFGRLASRRHRICRGLELGIGQPTAAWCGLTNNL